MPRSKATTTPDRQPLPIPPVRFVGGKGGVGKTTCAAAMGVLAARSGRRTLIVSSDPAPSLGDALRQPLGPSPTKVRGLSNLFAVEIDASAALEIWVDARRGLLEEIALRGTWLDREDVTQLLRLSLPGIDEIAGLLQVGDFSASGAYDHIIVDTAPTGHLLRMLGLPAVLEGLAEVFDHMQAKHRIMVDALRGGWTPDAADALIAGIDAQARRMGSLLRDAAQARLAWVTLPEPMAIDETVDGLRGLRDLGVTVDRVIVNRLTLPPPGRCRWCSGRRRQEQQAIEALRKRTVLRQVPITMVPVAAPEPRGVPALQALGRLLEERTAVAPARKAIPTGPIVAVLPLAARTKVPHLAPDGTRLLMFGGKGGVGKTTCAAASAIELALATGSRRVLLLSADPAHSVGDVLGETISDVASRVRGGPPNLWVRELDAGRVFGELRERFANAIEDLFARVSGRGIPGNVAAHDRRVMRDLLELAPPGVDEIVAIIEVIETVVGPPLPSGYDLVVIDTAPTGHALRLIEMPGLVHDWVKAVMGILLKYQPVAGVGELGAVLLRLSQGLGRLREIMADPVRTRFVAVTRAAALPHAETSRLLDRLRAASVNVPMVLVNAVGGGTCRRCVGDRAAQQKEIASLIAALGRGPAARPEVVIAPARIPAPSAWRTLRDWRGQWKTLQPAPARTTR